MALYIALSIWLASDLSKGIAWTAGGLLKGILLPTCILASEYRAVVKQSQFDSALLAVVWPAISLVVIYRGVAIFEEGWFGAVLLLAFACILAFIGYAHGHWWAQLRSVSLDL